MVFLKKFKKAFLCIEFDVFRQKSINFGVFLIPRTPRNGYYAVKIMNKKDSFLFKLLQTQQTEQSLLEAVLEEFDIDSESAKADIKEFINMLRKSGVLEE